MAQIFVMPQPGSTMEEGTILRWHRREGEAVTEGETLLEIETDKAMVEIPAPQTGVVRKILAAENAAVTVRSPIAILGTADESIDALLRQIGIAAAEPTPAAQVETKTAGASPAEAAGRELLSLAQTGPVYLSPRAQRIAAEKGIAVAELAGRGSGPEGRVIERDILAYLEMRTPPTSTAPSKAERAAPRTTPLAARMADELGVALNDLTTGLPGSRVRSSDVLRHAENLSPKPDIAPAPTPTGDGVTSVPLAGMRKRIAENVTQSAFTAPHVTLTLEVDMTACAAFRESVQQEVEKTCGAKLSFTAILVKVVARALGEFPALNASLIGDEIRQFAHKNIGVAVALEEGLVVPVVQAAESKSLGAVSAELKMLIERARTGKFTPEDVSGGTFSITNLGAFGIDVFDPIIVTGQAGILGVGRISDKPVVVNKEVVVRSMMNLCLSFDHRILDGVPAARFLQRCQQLLENPLRLLI